jgi:hypothetical protein
MRAQPASIVTVAQHTPISIGRAHTAPTRPSPIEAVVATAPLTAVTLNGRLPFAVVLIATAALTAIVPLPVAALTAIAALSLTAIAVLTVGTGDGSAAASCVAGRGASNDRMYTAVQRCNAPRMGAARRVVRGSACTACSVSCGVFSCSLYGPFGYVRHARGQDPTARRLHWPSRRRHTPSAHVRATCSVMLAKSNQNPRGSAAPSHQPVAGGCNL